MVAAVLGFWGFTLYDAGAGAGTASIPDRLYQTLVLFALDTGQAGIAVPWPLQVGRFLALGVTVAIGFGALRAIFREEFARMRIKVFPPDVVVFGLGTSGVLLAQAYANQGRRVVGVDIDGERVRELRALAGVSLLVGDAAAPAVVAASGVANAQHAVVVTGDQGRNADIAVRIRHHVDASSARARRRAQDRVTCYLHVDDGELFDLMVGAQADGADASRVGFRFFNPSVLAAPAMVDQWRQTSGTGIDSDPPRLLIVGLGQLGRLALLQAVRSWWYADARRLEKRRDRSAAGSADGAGSLPAVMVLTAQPDEDRAALEKAEPQIESYCRLEIQAMDPRQPNLLADLVRSHGQAGLSGVLVTIEDDLQALTSALAVRDALDAHSGVPVIVRLQRREGLAAVLDEPVTGVPLLGFSLAEWSCQPDALDGLASRTVDAPVELMARLIHYDYQRGEAPSPDAAVSWGDLSEPLRESNRAQARDTRRKLAAIGCVLRPLDGFDGRPARFTAAEITKLARLEHDRWCAHQEADGWRPTASIEDPKTQTGRLRKVKRHPYLRPWEDLDQTTKEKDIAPMRSLPELLVRGGCYAERLEDTLARAIHEHYRQRVREDAQRASRQRDVPWSLLDPALRRSCEDQARHAREVLAEVGCVVVADMDAATAPLVRFTEGEVERMARWEHGRWCRQRVADGWLLDTIHDVEWRRTPDLLPWADLTEPVRELDRQAVRALPELIAGTGAFRVARGTSTG